MHTKMSNKDPAKCLELIVAAQTTMAQLPDALLGPGVNPLEGSPNVKLRKLGPKGTLPASNSRKG
jgi:hypothetical protein